METLTKVSTKRYLRKMFHNPKRILFKLLSQDISSLNEKSMNTGTNMASKEPKRGIQISSYQKFSLFLMTFSMNNGKVLAYQMVCETNSFLV